MDWRVPLFDPELGAEELAALEQVIDSKWLTQGAQTEAFEQEFGEFVGARFGVAVNSCTAALHLALEAVGVGPGDEVVCPSLTFVATANAVRYCGATPVFADVGSLDEWTICAETVEPLLSPRTRAILVVHYAGYMADMRSLRELSERQGICLIEDVAHAPGASRDGLRAGAAGDAGAFSFFSNKNMTTGEGGMLTTDDEAIAQRARKLRCHGMTSVTLDRHKGHNFSYDVVALGYNYRMSELNAAIGRVQLPRLPDWNAARARHVQAYRELLSEVEPVHVPYAHDPGEPTHHIFPVLLPEGTDRNGVMAALRDEGVQTSIHYRPVHDFAAYRDDYPDAPERLPLTETIGTRVLTLPLYPSMTQDQIATVCDSLKRHVG